MRYTIGLLLLALACADAPAKSATVPRAATELYAQLCASCHGDGMQGAKARGFAGIDAPLADAARLAAIIRDGVPAGGMPGFGATLSAAETQALALLIHETAGRATAPMPQAARALPAGIQRSEEHAYRIERIVDQLDVPWSIAFLPDRRMLFSERNGGLFTVTERNGRWQRPVPVTGVPPVWVEHEAGLMSAIPHPDFRHNAWIYLTLSDRGPDGGTTTKVVRARLRGQRLVDHQTVFAAPPSSYSDKGVNFGGRLLFDGNHLFFSFGERGELGQAQDLGRPNGKVHRLFHDGGVPPDNPFADRPGALASIWSYGHRNPQGLARNPADGGLWESEHGPRGGDELNHIRRGGNYGWPLATYGINYDGTPVSAHTALPGMEAPVLHWTPSIAVGALHFYAGDAFPRWKNQLFVGSLGQQELRRMVVDGDRVLHQEILLKGLGRVRDVATGPDGLLYVALELPHEPSYIVRLLPLDETH